MEIIFNFVQFEIPIIFNKYLNKVIGLVQYFITSYFTRKAFSSGINN